LFTHGKLIGVVKAKKLEVVAANVLEQTKRYSEGANSTIGEWSGYHVPFLYSSNGELMAKRISNDEPFTKIQSFFSI